MSDGLLFDIAGDHYLFAPRQRRSTMLRGVPRACAVGRASGWYPAGARTAPGPRERESTEGSYSAKRPLYPSYPPTVFLRANVAAGIRTSSVDFTLDLVNL